MDMVDASTHAQNELDLSRAQTELENVKTQLASADEHIEQFKMISASTERTLNEVREKFASEKKALQDELSSVTKEFTDFKKEHENSRGVELELGFGISGLGVAFYWVSWVLHVLFFFSSDL